MCGGTSGVSAILKLAEGLSPRVRGNQESARQRPAAHRSIPACAGEPGIRCSAIYYLRVYPRVCGGTTCSIVDVATVVGLSRVCGGTWIASLMAPERYGLSPRVRGNLGQPAGWRVGQRSIPACAGEPLRWTGATAPARVYPRVCGGTGLS